MTNTSRVLIVLALLSFVVALVPWNAPVNLVALGLAFAMGSRLA